MEVAKPWSVSASLRGFYDDNINSVGSGPNKVSAYGFDVSPSLGLNWSFDQTLLTLRYVYDFRYYDKRPLNNTEKYDQDHSFDLDFKHEFSERYRIDVNDSFVIGQEPDFIRAGNTLNNFQRVPGNNIRNYGTVNFDGELTRLLGFEVGYANGYYDYADTGATINGLGFVTSSQAGTLNRIEHTAHVDSHWHAWPDTLLVVGYQYAQIDYTGNELISGNVFVPGLFPLIQSSDRNSRTHSGYVGADHTFLPTLTGSVRVGVDYNDYYNDPLDRSNTSLSPRANASLSYAYATQSTLQVGFSYSRNATDIISVNNNNSSITTDEQSAVVFGSVRQRIMPSLFGTVTAQFQDSTFNGGSDNNQEERFYMVGLNLSYNFSPHFSTEVGYDYDKLESGIGRSFDRNKVYVGVTARY